MAVVLKGITVVWTKGKQVKCDWRRVLGNKEPLPPPPLDVYHWEWPDLWQMSASSITACCPYLSGGFTLSMLASDSETEFFNKQSFYSVNMWKCIDAYITTSLILPLVKEQCKQSIFLTQPKLFLETAPLTAAGGRLFLRVHWKAPQATDI